MYAAWFTLSAIFALAVTKHMVRIDPDARYRHVVAAFGLIFFFGMLFTGFTLINLSGVTLPELIEQL